MAFHNKEKIEPSSTIISGLGRDLPNTEGELFELNEFPLLDAKMAITQLGDSTILIEMLKDFISLDKGQKDIAALQEAYRNKDWTLIENKAHKIKSGAVYLGTVRMKYACQYLERYIKAGHTTQCEALYHQLINVNGQTVEEINKWLKKYNF